MKAVDELSGRELDAAVAEEVMGFTHYLGSAVPEDAAHAGYDDDQEVWIRARQDPSSPFDRYCKWCGNLPCYSTDIAAAWQMVEGFQKDGWAFFLGEVGVVPVEPRWIATLRRRDREYNAEGAWSEGKADTAPQAICRAALKAVRENK